MSILKRIVWILAAFFATSAVAQVPDGARQADIVILGEIHDNPEHHQTQATWIANLRPRAVIYEMLLPDEATAINLTDRSDAALREAISGFHWSNIAEYLPLLQASDAMVIGAAAARDEVRRAFSEGAAAVFGDQSGKFGLDRALPEEQLAVRKQLQFEAHCEAMPLEMMGGMVEAQRFRDARFAQTALRALDEFGAPVVLVTGNGHARRDWGVPAYLLNARPELSVFALGQRETTSAPLEGGFDQVIAAPPPERDDPCAAFR